MRAGAGDSFGCSGGVRTLSGRLTQRCGGDGAGGNTGIGFGEKCPGWQVGPVTARPTGPGTFRGTDGAAKASGCVPLRDTMHEDRVQSTWRLLPVGPPSKETGPAGVSSTQQTPNVSDANRVAYAPVASV